MSDSVGKITLDLELKSDLEGQIEKISKQIGEKLKESINGATKGMFDGMNQSMDKNMKSMSDNLKSGLGKMSNQVKKSFSSIFSAAKNIKIPKPEYPKAENEKMSKTNTATSTPVTRPPPKYNVEQLKTQIESAERVLETTNNQIDRQREKIMQLKEAYSQAFNITKKNKLTDDLLRAEMRLDGLISKSDRYGFKLADLDAKMAEFAASERLAAEAGNELAASQAKLSATSTIGNGMESLGKRVREVSGIAELAEGGFGKFGKVMSFLGKGMKTTGNAAKSLGSHLKNLISPAENCNKSFGRMHYGIGMLLKQFFTWMIVFPFLMRGINALASGLWADLKANEQFNSSLEQIKTNLMVAFTPIYQAILPAINAFMNALATLSYYIASFISAIFGKTYQESFDATQGLIDAKQAMGAYGDAAKETANEIKGLVGIDEINNLNKSGSAAAPDTSKVPKLVTPKLDTSAIDKEMQDLIDAIKELLSKLFQPVKEAWDSQGQATMDALKYALDKIWDLIKAIAKDFLDIWTNGTGKRFVEDLLKLLQMVFLIIGDIAQAFTTAWQKGELGKQLIQAMFDALHAIAELLLTIGQTFRDVWNSGVGVEICTNILEILKNVFTIIGQIATSFKTAWDAGIGKQLMTDILGLLNNCLKIINDITLAFSKAWESNGDTICAAILLILDNIVGTITDITGAWIVAWNDNGAGQRLLDALLSTLGKILSTIGDITTGIRGSLKDAAETVFPEMIKFATDFLDNLGKITDGFKKVWDDGGSHLLDGIIQLIAKCAELILKIVDNAFTDFSNFFKDISPLVGAAADILGHLIDVIDKLISYFDSSKLAADGLRQSIENLITALPGLSALDRLYSTYKKIKNMDWSSSSDDDEEDEDGYDGYTSDWDSSDYDVPYYATGGVIDTPQLAMVGESGKEAVMPLENNTGWINELAGQLAGLMGTGNRSVSTSQDGGDVIFMLDSDVIGKVAISQIRKAQRQGKITVIPT